MKYLPYENITYETNLGTQEVLKRVNEVLEPKKTFRLMGILVDNEYKDYEGHIRENSFEITRIIEYRNSFLPIIKGYINENSKSTKINVKMRLQPFLLVFLFIWCGGIGFVFLLLLSASIEKKTFDPNMLIPLLMCVFAYLLTTISFKHESKKSKKYLTKLFEAK